MIKNSFLRIAAIALLLTMAAAAGAAAEVVAEHAGGVRENIEGVTVLRLQGKPYDIGYQHGVLLKDEIKALLNYFFVEKEKVFGMSHEEIGRAAEVLKKYIPEEYMEEMRGIAEGAGVEFEKVLHANTFLDAVSAGWMGVKAPRCSNFAAMPENTAAGIIVHGRNLDWSQDRNLTKANVVFFITPEDGVPFASLSWAGMTGTLTGMNSEQISMGEMTSMSYEASLDGVPIMILLRMLLERAGTLEEAYSVLADNPRTTGYNALITDGKIDSGIVVEMSAENIFRKGPDDGFLVRTNHYLHPKLAATQKKAQAMMYGKKKTNSHYRYDRITQLLEENKGDIGVDTAKSILRDKFDLESGEISDDYTNTVCKKSTLQSVVMVPETGELYVALTELPAPEGDYVKLKLDVVSPR